MSFGDFVEAQLRRRWRLVLPVVVWFGGLGWLVASLGWPFLVWLGLVVFTVPTFVAVLRLVRDRWPALDPFKVSGGEPAADDGDVPVYLGQMVDGSLYGSPLWLSPKGKAGVVVTGVPGTGKTVLLRLMVQGLIEQGASVTVVDFKASGDFAVFESFGVTVIEGDDVAGVVAALEGVNKLRAEMTARLKKSQTRNWWDNARGTRGPCHVVLIDECQALFETSGLPKDEKELMEKGAAAVRSLVKLGRSAGFVTILATQKATTDAVPSSVREQADVRIAGRVKTREAAKAALGELPGEGEPSPLDLPPGVPGWFVLSGCYPVNVFFQAPYLSDSDIVARLRASRGGSV